MVRNYDEIRLCFSIGKRKAEVKIPTAFAASAYLDFLTQAVSTENDEEKGRLFIELTEKLMGNEIIAAAAVEYNNKLSDFLIKLIMEKTLKKLISLVGKAEKEKLRYYR